MTEASTPIVFLDTETTGVHPGRRVWEVAMIRREESGKQDELSFMVQVDLSEADPFGLSVGRFYERHPDGRNLSGRPPLATSEQYEQEAITSAAASEYVARWTYGAHVVGAVPNFDTEVLAALLREHGLIPAWHYHLIDVENLAVGYLAGRRELPSFGPPREQEKGLQRPIEDLQPPWSSEALSLACGVEPASENERHTALGDARWAMRLYDKITTGTV